MKTILIAALLQVVGSVFIPGPNHTVDRMTLPCEDNWFLIGGECYQAAVFGGFDEDDDGVPDSRKVYVIVDQAIGDAATAVCMGATSDNPEGDPNLSIPCAAAGPAAIRRDVERRWTAAVLYLNDVAFGNSFSPSDAQVLFDTLNVWVDPAP